MIEVRPIVSGEVRHWRGVILQTFGMDQPTDEESLARADQSFLAQIDLARANAAFDGDELVGGAATFDLELAIPGATLPMGGLTMVAVKPSHRRRGILRRFVEAHLDGCAERGQSISGLWASEAAIYGRFGYGPIGDSEAFDIAADKITLATGVGGDSIRLHGDAANDPEARDAAIEIYRRVWPTRPGMFDRTPAWWTHRIFNLDRPGASKNRARMAVSRRDGELTGFVAFKQHFAPGAEAGGRIEIIELIAVDATAETSLWRFLVGVDLFPRIKWWNAPADSLGPWLATNRRSFSRTRTDSLWLRINDVSAAFSARRYETDGAITFAVADSPEIWRLAIENGAGTCEPTTGEPDLLFDHDALGSVYLGGVDPTLLWRAGRIRGSADAIASAARLLSWPTPPWCAEVF